MSSLSQLVAALQSSGPERASAEAQLDSDLAQRPFEVLAGLLKLARDGTDEGERVLALVLFRRLAFRAAGDDTSAAELLSKHTWDVLASQQRQHVQSALLELLKVINSRKERERSVTCDAVSATAKSSIDRQAPWPALSATLSTMFGSPMLAEREACFRIYSECPALLQSESAQTVTTGLGAGLSDDSPGVKLAALAACCALLQQAEVSEITRYGDLVVPMLQVLPPLVEQRAESRLTTALLSLIELASTPKIPSRVFKPHLPQLLDFALSVFTPSPYAGSSNYSSSALDETVRQPAIELLVSIAETAPAMTKALPEFCRKLVPALLQVMTEVEEDSDWLYEEVIQDHEDDSIAVVAEAALDRIARALDGSVFEPFLQHVRPMVESSRWQDRHAGLSAIAAVAEGTSLKMQDQLQYFVTLAAGSVKDEHPRVRYAAVFALGQMCTDLDGQVQSEYGIDALRAFVTVMNNQESRLQAFGAAALVNFFNGGEPDAVEDVLPDVFQQLLVLLQRGTNFVKGNALEAMTLLARSMLDKFSPFYPLIMPDLLNLLETTSDELEQLRAKALDCTASIAGSVDSSYFAPDAERLLTTMHRMHETLPEDDEQTRPFLLNAFSLLGLTVGPEAFAPYLNDVFPHLLKVANRKTEATIGGEEGDEEEGWETVELDGGELMAIRTAGLEEKADAVGNLVLIVQACREKLPIDALHQVLETGVSLLSFYFDLRVRESAAALVAVALKALSGTSLPEEQKALALNTCSDAFAKHIAQDTDAEIVATLVESWTASVGALPNSLSRQSRQTILKALESQLTLLVQREQERSHAVNGLGGQQDADEDDLLELEQLAEQETIVYWAINLAIKWLVEQYGYELPVTVLKPFLNLMTASKVPREFGLRLFADLTIAGEQVVTVLAEHAERVLESVSDLDESIRRNAAYAVGVAAERIPVGFEQFVVAAIEPLFASIGPVDTVDSDALSARDNAVSALGKIIKALSHRPDVQALLPKWIESLPVLVDGDEMTATNELLISLIANNHPCVSPSNGAVARHIVKCFVATLQADEIPATLEAPVARALKEYMLRMPADAVELPPRDVQEKMRVV
ncbi:importin subunit beta-3 [Microbotryomycetes sp. JL201]|nr:importin subunit beta-3 [Microbotryomycetes sp. JL201]